ncbi:MAG: lysozyme inhibitor LprI family protein [Beijerinckiaceae bacterium]
MLRTIAFALAVSAAIPATAQPRPSFDCGRAREAVEKAICGSPELATLDRDIARTFNDLRRKIDPDTARALKEEQDTFNATREIALESRDTTLRAFMRDHLQMLRRMDPAPAGEGAAAFTGEWRSGAGSVKIKAAKAGALTVEINTVAAILARWVCEVSGEAKVADGRLSFTEDDVVITLARKGASLEVTEKLKDGQMRDYCGANGAVEGSYFRMRPGR